MKKLVFLFVLTLFSTAIQAAIKSQIEPSSIAMGDNFRLILSQDDPQNGGVPDLTELQKDFVIIGTERQVNYSIINGQPQSLSQWIVTLKPKKTGTLEVPAIKIGIDQTAPAHVVVTAGSAHQEGSDNTMPSHDLMLTTNTSSDHFYVNQQILYTVKLYNSKRLLDADYQGPEADDALIIPLGEAKRYQTVQNNTTYVVEEQNYAIFPQKSGALKIKSPVFTALVYDLDSQRVKVQDKTMTLQILPAPQSFHAAQWLPAEQLKLSEAYENTAQTLTQGSTLTRTITIEGKGIPAQLLPDLAFPKTDGFSVYPEKGKERNQIVQGELVSSREIKVTYLFNQAGKVMVPELKCPWFDTKSEKNEVALLPPRRFIITPAAAPHTNQHPQGSGATFKALDADLYREDLSTHRLSWSWVFAFVLGFAWVLTLILWRLQTRWPIVRKNQHKASLQALHKACKTCNPQKAREALMDWARSQWPDASVLNLTDLAQLTRDVSLKKQLSLLTQALYKDHQKALWRGDELWRAVCAIKRKRHANSKKSQSLPPINPL